MSGCYEPQEPVTIRLHVAAAVAEVVTPSRSILYLTDGKGLLQRRFRRLHVAPTLLVAVIAGIADGVMGHEERVLPHPLVDIQAELLLGNDDEAVFGLHTRGAIDGAAVSGIADVVDLLAHFHVAHVRLVGVAFVLKQGGYGDFLVHIVDRNGSLGYQQAVDADGSLIESLVTVKSDADRLLTLRG